MTDDQRAALTISSAAERMRRYRKRRRKGLRCFTLEILEGEVDALVHRGHLQATERNDRRAVKRAFYVFLDRTLRREP